MSIGTSIGGTDVPQLQPPGARRMAVHVCVASFVLNLLGLALPLVLLQTYDRIIPNSSHGTLLMLVMGVVSATILEAILRVARSEIMSWVGIQFEHRAGSEAFSRVLRTPVDELERSGAGELIEKLSNLRMVREVYAEQWTLLVCDLPFVMIFLGLIWYLAGSLVIAPVAVLVLFVIAASRSFGSAERAVAEYNTVRDRRQNFGIEVIQGIHAIKSMAMEGQMIQRYARLQEAVANAFHAVVLGNSNALAVGQAFSQIATLSVVVVGGLQVVDNALTVGGLSACTLLTGRALQPLQRAVSLWTRYQTARAMRRRFTSLFDLPVERRTLQAKPAELAGAIELQDISFRYGAADQDVLFDQLQLTVKPGERIAILGDNGSGKSTLLRLMLGIVEPGEGRILIDGAPVETYDPASLRRDGIVYVPQRAELFRGTILENLTMFRPELRAEALSVSKGLGLDEVIYRLPQGYNTRVGDGSSEMLPRGVTQRIAIARALAVKPRILLFDESNAAMDARGDEMLRRYLEDFDRSCTLILVTLRPSLQKLADRVLSLKNGRLEPPTPTPAAPTAPSGSGEGGNAPANLVNKPAARAAE